MIKAVQALPVEEEEENEEEWSYKRDDSNAIQCRDAWGPHTQAHMYGILAMITRP